MSLNTMFTIIKTYGREFRIEWWNDLFKIVFRIFDFSKLNELGSEVNFDSIHMCYMDARYNLFQKNEWMMNTCNLALCSIVDVFTYSYDVLAPKFLNNIYQQFYICVQHGNEDLAKMSIECFENLVGSNGSKFEKSMWEETISLIIDIFENTAPDFKSTDPAVWKSVHTTPTTVSNPDNIMPNGMHPVKRQLDEDSPTEANGTLSQGRMAKSSTNYQDLTVQNSSLVRCVVQLELVDKVSCIIFGRNPFRVEGPIKRSSNSHVQEGCPPSPNSLNDDYIGYSVNSNDIFDI